MMTFANLTKKMLLCNFVAFLALDPCVSFARKTNQALYEEPFDTAAGGAALTRSSREAVIFTNPANMPYGGKFHRWIGNQFTILTARESIAFAANLASGQTNQDSGSILRAAFNAPVHFGFQNGTNYITNNFAVGAFVKFESDTLARDAGEFGTPDLRLRADLYAGLASAFAMRIAKWMSIGVTTKYLYVAEPDVVVELTDEEATDRFNDPQQLSSSTQFGRGLGVDVGTLMFFQGKNVDYRFALKVDDAGDTKFGESREPFKQTIHVGMGWTLHNDVDALHLAMDFRDVNSAYGEHWFKRTYLGGKILLRQYVGLAAGLYQGTASGGILLDFVAFKLGLTTFTKTLGPKPNMDKRTIYMVNFTAGF